MKKENDREVTVGQSLLIYYFRQLLIILALALIVGACVGILGFSALMYWIGQ